MSTGYLYGEEPPTMPCPYCGAICEADWVDIGVGMQQCGPFHCDACLASQVGPYDDTETRPLTADEQRTQWYAPATPPGSSANVIRGRLVTHRQMLRTYKDVFTGNALWHDQSFVEDWWATIREPLPATKETPTA